MRRPVCSFLQLGRVRLGWAVGIGRLLPPSRLLRVCFLAVCFDDSEVNRRRYSNERLESTIHKQDRVREQIRSRINLELCDRSWSVPVANINHQKWGLSQNDTNWLYQPQRRDRCVNVSLIKALGWYECKISTEQILHFDPFISPKL